MLGDSGSDNVIVRINENTVSDVHESRENSVCDDGQ